MPQLLGVASTLNAALFEFGFDGGHLTLALFGFGFALLLTLLGPRKLFGFGAVAVNQRGDFLKPPVRISLLRANLILYHLHYNSLS